MNMLNSQIKELREKADMLDGLEGMDNLVRMLREAADTIEGLRRQVAKCQIAELKADYDTSRYSELFGTPERAARTLIDACDNCGQNDCSGCQVFELTHGGDMDYDTLLEWLKGGA